jgi:DNA-binding HxlR family transcriptional regulator
MKRATAPLPGTRVRGSATGRPIMALFDLLGRRATLRIVWELSKTPLTFRALEAAAETNPSVLNSRLRELREAGIVELGEENGYALTAEGRALVAALAPVEGWARRWGKRRVNLKRTDD